MEHPGQRHGAEARRWARAAEEDGGLRKVSRGDVVNPLGVTGKPLNAILWLWKGAIPGSEMMMAVFELQPRLGTGEKRN